MVPSVVGEIAKLKGNATPNAIAPWREIKAYEVSATELFGAGKSTQRGDVHHLQFGLHPTGAGTFSLFFLFHPSLAHQLRRGVRIRLKIRISSSMTMVSF